ncbi:MAG: hypothetical protein ACPKPY_01795 [Nitrososphaeraceae archaeon]
MRTFLEWYNSVPEYIKKENKTNDKICEINYILKKIVKYEELDNKKPTIEELRNWVNTKQI